jgi:flagellar motility protein MotE (MotC chaperone)
MLYNRKKTFILFFALLTSVLLLNTANNNAFAQVATLQENPFSKENYTEAKKLERLVYNTILPYLKGTNFLVDVKIKSPQFVMDSVVPVLDTTMSVDYLPGVMDGSNVVTNDEGVYAPFNIGSGKQKTVLVVMDTCYDSNALGFIDQLIRNSIPLDAANGDRLIVQSQVFPPAPNAYQDFQKAGANVAALSQMPPQMMPQQQPQQQPPQAFPQNSKTEPTAAADKGLSLSDFLPYLAILLIIMVFAFVLLYLLLKPKKNTKAEEALQILNNKVEQLETAQKNPAVNNQEENLEQYARLAEMRSYVTKEFISNKAKVADLFNNWVEEDERKGLQKIVNILKATNPKLLPFLNSHLSKDNYNYVEISLDDTPTIVPEEQLKQIEEFKKEINTLPSAPKTKERDIFHFLNQLNEQQIMFLIKEESEELAAIVLAQLPPKRSMGIIRDFDSTKQSIILQKMSSINDLSVAVYKEIASYFSAKAMAMNDMKYVSLDGLKTITGLLDTLPTGEQKKYIDELAGYDLDLARKIKERFITFEEIFEQEDVFLQRALEEVESVTIARALINADETIVEKLVNLRPKREQLLIKSEIDYNKDLALEEIEKARKIILDKLKGKLTA